MQQINCLIIDDEPIAKDLLVEYCSYMSMLNVVAVCATAFEAREIILGKPVDLIFLDINMPVLDGISFVKTLKNPPQIIITTAYREHAVTAFDVGASDYLVKPFSLERFMQAVDKAGKLLSPEQTITGTNKEYILIKTENKIFNVKTEDVLFAEAKGNYTHIFFIDKVLKPKLSLSAFEQLVPSGQFLRVHRSFIINRTKIKHIEGNLITINKYEVPVGSSFKEQFINTLNLK
jgi:DNA-binding LytR/AlgR family response regulator